MIGRVAGSTQFFKRPARSLRKLARDLATNAAPPRSGEACSEKAADAPVSDSEPVDLDAVRRRNDKILNRTRAQ